MNAGYLHRSAGSASTRQDAVVPARALASASRTTVTLALVSAILLSACTLPSHHPDVRRSGRPPTHGWLLSSRRVEGPSGTRVWRVRYLSQRADGASAAVTGVVIAPRRPPPAGGFPIVT